MVYLQSSTVLDTEIQRKKDICNFLATNRRRNKISMDMEGKDFKHTICTFLYLRLKHLGSQHGREEQHPDKCEEATASDAHHPRP